MNKVRDVLSIPQQNDVISTQRPTVVSQTLSPQHFQSSTNSTTFDPKQRTRARKPSPGLAARLQALGFGRETTKPETRLDANDRIGRIPEDHINRLDEIHRANSTLPLQPRGRTWSGNFGGLITQRTRRSYTEVTIPDQTMLEVSKRQSLPVTVPSEIAFKMNYNRDELDSPQTHHFHENSDDHGDLGNHDDNSASEVSETKYALADKYVSPDSTPLAPLKDILSESDRSSQPVSEITSHFNPLGSQRNGSIYTLSRVSFATQLAQLTSLQLPDAESLSSKVLAIPTSIAALEALMRATEQIQSWISKAFEVISGLDGEDDVEWAAAGGRDGLGEVDSAIIRFETLINVYVTAIKSLQARDDISTVSPEALAILASQVQFIISEWSKIKNKLKEVKTSVEIAMEWEELWNIVLGDIGQEMDRLKNLVFEMEENRHKSAARVEDRIGLADLETIVEEAPISNPSGKFDVSFILSPITPNSPNRPEPLHDDSNLLALFAKMQPLRASLDFFPMRLSAYLARADKIFPTACKELETRLNELEDAWRTLKKDAESLQKELGEDRWVLVFRVASGQALKMYNSVERSFLQLKESLHENSNIEDNLSLCKHFEKKRAHFGQAIERVLSIIDQGVKDRLTLNGEIILIHSEMQHKWDALKKQISDFDVELAEFKADKNERRTRESISSMVSNDHSIASSLLGTPHTSPASSVIFPGHRGSNDSSTLRKSKSRNRSSLPTPGGRSSLTVGTTSLPRKSLTNRLSTNNLNSVSHLATRQRSSTPTGNRSIKNSTSHSNDGKPRWNTSTKVPDGMIGHNYKPLGLTNPSQHPNTTYSSRSPAHSKIPTRSPLSRGKESLSVSEPNPSTPSRSPGFRLSLRERLVERISTPNRLSQQNFSQSYPARTQAQSRIDHSPPNVNNHSNKALADSPDFIPSQLRRTMTPNGTNHRASLLPLPKQKLTYASQPNSPEVSGIIDTSHRSSEKKPLRV